MHSNKQELHGSYWSLIMLKNELNVYQVLRSCCGSYSVCTSNASDISNQPSPNLNGKDDRVTYMEVFLVHQRIERRETTPSLSSLGTQTYQNHLTDIPKHTSCTQPQASPNLSHENAESRYLSCNNHASKGALPPTSPYNDEPRIKTPAPACNRAVGACCHTDHTGRQKAPEAENCNCNCRFEGAMSCDVTDRDQEETRRRGTCVSRGLFQSFLRAGIDIAYT
jgi:hypothetical protein